MLYSTAHVRLTMLPHRLCANVLRACWCSCSLTLHFEPFPCFCCLPRVTESNNKDKDEDTDDAELGQHLPCEWGIQLDQFGVYHLIVQYKVKCMPEDKPVQLCRDILVKVGQEIKLQLQSNLLVQSCDPSIRNPLSVYSSNGMTFDIVNSKDSNHLWHLQARKDSLRSKQQLKKEEAEGAAYALPAAKCQQLWCKECQICKHQTCLFANFHCCASSCLALTSDVTIMPQMETKQMVQRGHSKLSKVTKQSLLAWVHCSFFNCLCTTPLCSTKSHAERKNKMFS